MANNTSWRSKLTVEERIALRRSNVRTSITHGAAWFLFGGGGALVLSLLIWGGSGGGSAGPSSPPNLTVAVDLFQTILPIAASIVTFWFAGRVYEKNGDNEGDSDPKRP